MPVRSARRWNHPHPSRVPPPTPMQHLSLCRRDPPQRVPAWPALQRPDPPRAGIEHLLALTSCRRNHAYATGHQKLQSSHLATDDGAYLRMIAEGCSNACWIFDSLPLLAFIEEKRAGIACALRVGISRMSSSVSAAVALMASTTRSDWSMGRDAPAPPSPARDRRPACIQRRRWVAAFANRSRRLRHRMPANPSTRCSSVSPCGAARPSTRTGARHRTAW